MSLRTGVWKLTTPEHFATHCAQSHLDLPGLRLSSTLRNTDQLFDAASPDAMRRVSATFEAVAVWGKTEGASEAGRLTADLDPTK